MYELILIGAIILYLIYDKFFTSSDAPKGDVTYEGVSNIVDKAVSALNKETQDVFDIVHKDVDALESSNQDQNVRLLKLSNELTKSKSHAHPSLEAKIDDSASRIDTIDGTINSLGGLLNKIADDLDSHGHQDLANRILKMETSLDSIDKQVKALNKINFL